MNWDDLRILLAVRDEGSYARAGARLHINETTVARRLSRLESSLGMKLFDAVDGVRRPTASCASVLEHADLIARQVAAISSAATTGPDVVGRVRVAATSSIADELLAPRAAALLTESPGLTLQFLISGQNVNFSRWEADLAIRLARPAKGDFTITRLAKMSLYFLEPAARPEEGDNLIVCCYPDELDQTPESRFLTRAGIKRDGRMVTESLSTIRHLIGSHKACGILPAYASADLLKDPRLRATQLTEKRDVWLLVQSHLKRDPATRMVIDWIRAAFD